MTEVLSVARCGRRWAVKHKGGFLGYADSQEQADSLADHLRRFLANERRAERPVHRPCIFFC